MLMMLAVYQGDKKVDSGFVPDPKKMEEMTRFNEELGKAVKIISLNGLHPIATGARVVFGNGKVSVTDGPFIEAKEVLEGYWMVEADSKEELVKWRNAVLQTRVTSLKFARLSTRPETPNCCTSTRCPQFWVVLS